MNFPADLKYTKDHEWIKIEDNIATVGITDFAQKELGDIVYVEIETEGDDLSLWKGVNSSQIPLVDSSSHQKVHGFASLTVSSFPRNWRTSIG